MRRVAPIESRQTGSSQTEVLPTCFSISLYNYIPDLFRNLLVGLRLLIGQDRGGARSRPNLAKLQKEWESPTSCMRQDRSGRKKDESGNPSPPPCTVPRANQFHICIYKQIHSRPFLCISIKHILGGHFSATTAHPHSLCSPRMLKAETCATGEGRGKCHCRSVGVNSHCKSQQ